MRAHQRESQACTPRSGPGDSSTVKALEAKLAEVIAEGKKLGTGGCTFDESEKNAALRREVERSLKEARRDSKADKRAIKQLAESSMSAASWTQGVLDGDAKYVNRCEEQGMDIKSLREGGKALVALLQGVADENGYENLSPKAKLPSYSNLFGMA